MKSLLIRWLRLLLVWLDPPPLQAPPLVDPVLTAARELVREQRRWFDRSGESKRHQVYATLIKAFPAESRRRLSLVIEQAVELEGS